MHLSTYWRLALPCARRCVHDLSCFALCSALPCGPQADAGSLRREKEDLSRQLQEVRRQLESEAAGRQVREQDQRGERRATVRVMKRRSALSGTQAWSFLE